MNNGYFSPYGYCPFAGNINQRYGIEPEQINWPGPSQELEDAKRIRASVSCELDHTDEIDPTRQDLDPQSSRVVNQLGPWHTGYITFSGGVPVGGYADLTLYSNGRFNFNGHFHVSGAPSYNYSFAWAVKDARGNVYVFAHKGRLHGTFESGSRDDNWNKTGVKPEIAQNWLALQGWSWKWSAKVNINFGALVDSVVKAVAAGQAIAKVIQIFV